MSETGQQVDSYQILKKLTDNEIGEILSRSARVKDLSQVTKRDIFLLKQGKKSETMFDVFPSKFNESNADFFDKSKGKAELKVLESGKVVANVDNKRLELKIGDNYGNYVFSDAEKKELSENGYIKERITMAKDFDVFISVDKELNCLVSMPIKRLNVPTNPIGEQNPLTDDQLKSLRDGWEIKYLGYKDKNGNVSNKTVTIDRINGIVQVIPLRSGLDAAKKAEVAKSQNVSENQAESNTKEETKKKSKGVSV